MTQRFNLTAMQPPEDLTYFRFAKKIVKATVNYDRDTKNERRQNGPQ